MQALHMSVELSLPLNKLLHNCTALVLRGNLSIAKLGASPPVMLACWLYCLWSSRHALADLDVIKATLHPPPMPRASQPRTELASQRLLRLLTLAIVCDFPVPGGPCTTMLCPVQRIVNDSASANCPGQRI